MIVRCDQCSTKFRLDDSKVKDNGVKVRCSKCRHVFVVYKEAPHEESDFDAILGGLGASLAEKREDRDRGPSPHPHEEDGEKSSSEDTSGEAQKVNETSVVPGNEPGAEREFTEDTFGGEAQAAAFVAGFDFGGETRREESSTASTYGNLQAEMASPVKEGLDSWDTGRDHVGEKTGGNETEEFSVDIGGREEDTFVVTGEPPAPECASEPDTEATETAGESFEFGSSVVSTDTLPPFPIEEQREQTVTEDEEPFFTDVVSAHSSPGQFGSPSAAEPDAVQEVSAVTAEEKIDIAAATVSEPTVVGFGGMLTAPPAVQEMANEELPPLSISSRRQGRPLFPMVVATISVLFIIVLAGTGFYFLNEGPAAINKLGLDPLAKWVGLEAASEAGTVSIRNLVGTFLTNKEAGEIFVINGEAVNEFRKPRASIQVKATLFGAAGESILQKNIYCGNVLSKEQLATLPMAKIDAAMNNQFGDSLSNLGVQPGKGIPFVVVFTKVPKDAAEFGVEVVGSTVASP